jgi:chitin disaccharide deacetylase
LCSAISAEPANEPGIEPKQADSIGKTPIRHAIFTADDFGASSEINRAIIRVHRDGVLTAASLMVNGPAFEEAVEMARQTPTLAVGLHMVITDGATALPPAKIPHLVGPDGLLPRDPAKAGLHLAISPPARQELAAELRAQFEKFAATGLRLAHVDGHMHMHVHPAVLPMAARLATEFKASGMRLPCEPVGPVIRSKGAIGVSGVARTAVLAMLALRARPLLRKNGLKYPIQCYGISRTGAMEHTFVTSILERLSVASAEFVFHPTEGPRRERLGANPGDLETLLSPSIRAALERRGVQLANYYTLPANGHST